jgi:hypothetical protein
VEGLVDECFNEPQNPQAGEFSAEVYRYVTLRQAFLSAFGCMPFSQNRNGAIKAVVPLNRQC